MYLCVFVKQRLFSKSRIDVSAEADASAWEKGHEKKVKPEPKSCYTLFYSVLFFVEIPVKDLRQTHTFRTHLPSSMLNETAGEPAVSIATQGADGLQRKSSLCVFCDRCSFSFPPSLSVSVLCFHSHQVGKPCGTDG